MYPISFHNTLNWIFEEYRNEKSIFGIHNSKFYHHQDQDYIKLFGEHLETPIGPAAGPHTQLTQNIISAYISGGRFFELKTVQQMDELVIDRPCIDAEDEGYNVEWSQELKLEESYDEYLKAWILLHLLNDVLGLSSGNDKGFIFNMSVGYDLAGIKTERMDKFIEDLKESKNNKLFGSYISAVIDFLRLKGNDYQLDKIPALINKIENISSKLSGSVTLSTMHGCPPQEIESIVKYLLTEKKLNTYVKLNPTLLGYERVKDILFSQGYKYIDLDPESFDHDLKYSDAVPMLKRLKEIANENNLEFGVKLSNTLGMNNRKQKMPGAQMYMSGRALFPLTINLAAILAEEFEGNLNVSFSGGASLNNINSILSTGILPVTLVTDLLKPGGYTRLKQIADNIVIPVKAENSPTLKVSLIKEIAIDSLTNKDYSKETRDTKSIKTGNELPLFDCYTAPCSDVCPVHQDIPEYIRLIEEDRFDEAFELIVSKNPLPNITGYICDHQCMFKCTRWDYDSPLLIRDLKRVAAENGYDNYLDNFKPAGNSNGINVAIIGAGPAGLASGYFLAKSGFDVTIFDKAEKAGGTVRNVIPEFRLPQSAIDKDIEFIKQHGVKFSLNNKGNLSVENLQKYGYKYIFLAIGTGVSSPIQIIGGESIIRNAIEFLWNYHKKEIKPLGKNVAVVGGGNSAMDSARAAIRCEGVEKVYILYRRTKEFMPADKEELDAALEDGVIFKDLILPVEYPNGILKCSKMKLTEPGDDGRRKVVSLENEFEEINIDTVISAIGESVDTDFLSLNKVPVDINRTAIVDDATNETMLSNVFIGGDALRGPSTVIESIADGRKAAEAIMKKERIKTGSRIDTSKLFDNNLRNSDLAKRKGEIISQAKEDLKSESERCLGCNIVCNKCVEVCPNRANVAILSGSGNFKDKFQILHLDGSCNGCGNCETFCPYNGAPYKEKITLFGNEADFIDSKNNGFVFLDIIKKGFLKYRLNGSIGTANMVNNSCIIELDPDADDNLEKLKLSILISTIKNDHNYLIN
jgi:putative selenate reductase